MRASSMQFSLGAIDYAVLGVYFVFVEVASAKMPFQKSPFLTLEAEGARP